MRDDGKVEFGQVGVSFSASAVMVVVNLCENKVVIFSGNNNWVGNFQT